MLDEIENLFARQAKAWPRLTKGLEGLARAQTRRVRAGWFDVFVRHIPHRAGSTTAAVDPESISKRPCFLCAGNLDPEQEGIAFSRDSTIYCNPFPIVDRHLTIVHRDHGLQQIAGQFDGMLDLARALPGYFVIYNGPECGASAPDHMHFQAGSRQLFPIENDMTHLDGITIPHYSRNVFVFRGGDKKSLETRVGFAISLLPVAGKQAEPLINIVTFYDAEQWTVFLFPRGKHRPEVFHTGELTVSPASIDLCGIFVAPFERDFERISGNDIDSIFREVTLPDEMFAEIVQKLEARR